MAKIETSNFKRLIGVWKTEGTILNIKENLTLLEYGNCNQKMANGPILLT